MNTEYNDSPSSKKADNKARATSPYSHNILLGKKKKKEIESPTTSQ